MVTRGSGPDGRPIWFGAVQQKKSTVTFHLMPLYFNPAMEAAVSAGACAAQAGKTCFNFQRPDKALFAQLDALVRRARQQWERHGLLEPGEISQERFAVAQSGRRRHREAGQSPGGKRPAAAKNARRRSRSKRRPSGAVAGRRVRDL